MFNALKRIYQRRIILNGIMKHFEILVDFYRMIGISVRPDYKELLKKYLKEAEEKVKQGANEGLSNDIIGAIISEDIQDLFQKIGLSGLDHNALKGD